jgi:hypothetical protein
MISFTMGISGLFAGRSTLSVTGPPDHLFGMVFYKIFSLATPSGLPGSRGAAAGTRKNRADQ